MGFATNHSEPLQVITHTPPPHGSPPLPPSLDEDDPLDSADDELAADDDEMLPGELEPEELLPSDVLGASTQQPQSPVGPCLLRAI